MNTMSNQSNGFDLKGLFIALVVALLAVGGYALLTAPDNRSASERMGDAAKELGRGNIGDAASQLQDRSAAERAGDALKDAGNAIHEHSN